MRKQIYALFVCLIFFSISSFGVSRVENCIANGQFSTNKESAIQKCADHTTLSQKDCATKVKCFGPISFCMTGTTTGNSLESVIAECSRTKAATDCENSLKCFSNVSSCVANGQVGTTAEEALSYCIFRTKMSRSQCQQNLSCQEEQFPMPSRPAPAHPTFPPPSLPPPNVR